MNSFTVKEAQLFLIPVPMRVPLKFGDQILTEVTCARIKVVIETEDGKRACGWGETPLSVGWVWPSAIDYDYRQERLVKFTKRVCREAISFSDSAVTVSPVDFGFEFIEQQLPAIRQSFNQDTEAETHLPLLASLVCFSPFDIAVHDAFGNLHETSSYQTYTKDFMRRDLSSYFENDAKFKGRYISEFLVDSPPSRLPVWHLVGGLDPIAPEELTGNEPEDGYPVLLSDWIRRDGLNCLKVKLRGNDWDWDWQRLSSIGHICSEERVDWLTADFNCTVTDPDYVNSMLDRILGHDAMTYQKILYVEQPFPHDLEANQIDVHSVSARKPLFMDESAHDWKFVRMGRELGWNGVALKTCKTQTGALLSLCWAKAHGMSLMVQDLTNPMLAQIPHFQLASHAGTLMGVESNGMQFYPDASLPEQQIHPGLYRRSDGVLDGSTLGNKGFGYRVDEIERTLPDAVAS